MTIVHFSMSIPAADGITLPAVGSVRFTPTARRVVTGAPDEVVLPKPFHAPLIAGVVDVSLAPTTGAWAWRVDEFISGAPARTVYVAVPDVAEVDYPDLVTVDPATLLPDAMPAPIWETQLAGKVDVAAVGAADGVAPLGPDSRVPGIYLPEGSAGTVASTDITDSTLTGRALITATDAPAARGAIGAGTSSLVIGTGATDAMAGDRTFTKADVGLGSVDNTGDMAKPVSTAAQAALDAKADTATLTSHTGNLANPHAVTKAQVELGSVDNTADTAKPVSTAQQAALDLKINTSARGAANGVASLGADGIVPSTQLPASSGGSIGMNLITGSYALFNAGTAASAATGSAGTIYLSPAYIPKATSITELWSYVVTAAASSSMQFGYYTNDGSTFTKQATFGTVDTTSAGAKATTGAWTIQPGVIWLAWLPLGGTPTMRGTSTTPQIPGPFQVGPGNGVPFDDVKTMVGSGGLAALPASLTLTGPGSINNPVRFAGKVA